MSDNDQLLTIFELAREAKFPIYGVTDHLFDLSVSRYGWGRSALARLIKAIIFFTSPRYSSGPHQSIKSQNVEIVSVDAKEQDSESENIAYDLTAPAKEQLFDAHTGIFRLLNFSEEKQKQADKPLIWEGTLPIARIVFSGKIIHLAHPLYASKFFFKSEQTNLTGYAYGPAYTELVQILESLQVINHQKDLLRQYQYEFDSPQA